ncbi:Myosin-12 [Hondaea fermentalgiana]|uniref:Myosin-12 n=1 Tax=Hondaea fermentalgiana TaxID=2315210 RepID=A0A2R5GD18_9STRA|nr:Myosin-12 [Hondaea fermentalgiana]|eukprot:GBG28219.1 Myosin-12 [Hondaea fermentalgiana]
MDELNELPQLDEDVVVNALEARFRGDKPYTSAVGMCIAVNPFFRHENLYAPETQEAYAKELLDKKNDQETHAKLPPHLYRTSCASYADMRTKNRSQSILVSGESGAGKTESTKILMDHLAFISDTAGDATASAANRRTVARILQSNPLLEAFGNAKTVRNDNSSRFGKFIALQFNKNGLLVGAALSTYLLEKSRIAHQGSQERTFHVLYQLVNGGLDEAYAASTFANLQDLNSLPNNDDVDRDKVQGTATRAALRAIGLGDGHNFDGILSVLSTVLFLLEVDFVDAPDSGNAANVTESSKADIVPRLLSAISQSDDDSDASWLSLERVLTHRDIKVGPETISKPLDANASRANAQALAKALYASLFDWLVARINCSLCVDADTDSNVDTKLANAKQTIEILDIFGFECFEKNSLEQLCINFTNERLQQVFNESVLHEVQIEYEREGVPWKRIEHNDGAETIALIQGKNASVFGLLHEESVRPNGSDHAFVAKLTADTARKHLLRRDRFDKHIFSIEHFAGAVSYDARNFVDINLDSLNEGLGAYVRDYGSPFAASLMPSPDQPKSGTRALTLTFKFRKQLDELMTAIAATNTHFVRCIKPNTSMRRDIFDQDMVREQLRCSGVVEAIRISRAGYADRLPHAEVLRNEVTGVANTLDDALRYFLDTEKYFIGKTRVFFVHGALQELRTRRKQLLHQRALRIQTMVRGKLARNLVTRLRAALCLQRIMRGRQALARFRALRVAVVQVQALERARRGRQDFCRIVHHVRVLQRMGRRIVAHNARLASAASRIEAWTRMISCRIEFLQCRRGIVQLQARARAVLARQRFVQLLAAYRESQSIRGLQAEVRALKARIAELETKPLANSEHVEQAAENKPFLRKDWVPVATARKLKSALVRLSRENARLKTLVQDQDEQLTQLRNDSISSKEQESKGEDGPKVQDCDQENQCAQANVVPRNEEPALRGTGSFILKNIVSSGESLLRTMEGVGKFLLDEIDPLEFESQRNANRANAQDPHQENRRQRATTDLALYKVLDRGPQERRIRKLPHCRIETGRLPRLPRQERLQVEVNLVLLLVRVDARRLEAVAQGCRGGDRRALPNRTDGVQVFHADWDEQGVYFYQAYMSSIADWAVEHGKLGGPDFKPTRMTWIKPSFAWMLYRSSYASKVPYQERVLRIKLSHEGLAELLNMCVCKKGGGGTHGRVQWDPERDIMEPAPKGREPRKMLRKRAIQIGLAGPLAAKYVESIIGVEDVTELAHAVGAAHALRSPEARKAALKCLSLPAERPYMPRCSPEQLQRLAMLPGPVADTYSVPCAPLRQPEDIPIATNTMAGDDADISEQEAAVYDRQIRLWGFRTLNAEVCKNTVLAGVSVTIQDAGAVEAADLGGNFFLTSESLGANRAEAAAPAVQELNPLVKVGALTKAAHELTLEDLKPFTMVCAADCNTQTQVHLNSLCRTLKIGFLSARSFGWSAAMFQDLGDKHTYLAKTTTNKVDADGEKEVAYEPREVSFCPLETALAVPIAEIAQTKRKRRRAKAIRDAGLAVTEQFCALQVLQRLEAEPAGETAFNEARAREALSQIAGGASDNESSPPEVDHEAVLELVRGAQLGTELSPTCAVVGGIVGQELLKAMSGKDAPLDNFFFFDGISGGGIVRRIIGK